MRGRLYWPASTRSPNWIAKAGLARLISATARLSLSQDPRKSRFKVGCWSAYWISVSTAKENRGASAALAAAPAVRTARTERRSIPTTLLHIGFGGGQRISGKAAAQGLSA